jgi:hypothetical protein
MKRTQEELVVSIKAHEARSKPITMRQLRLKLLESGLLLTVEESMASASEAVKIEWQFGDVINRDNPLVASVSGSLNLSNLEVDEMFLQARML